MVGYSGTPLAKKLGINEGARVLTVRAPEDLGSWLHPLPTGVVVGVRLSTADVVVVFCRSSDDLIRQLPRALKVIGPQGSLWVAWPKKASGIRSDLQTRDVMMGIMLPTGLVDVKIAAISDVWSGLKFVVRTELRASWPAAGVAVP